MAYRSTSYETQLLVADQAFSMGDIETAEKAIAEANRIKLLTQPYSTMKDADAVQAACAEAFALALNVNTDPTTRTPEAIGAAATAQTFALEMATEANLSAPSLRPPVN